MRYKAVTQHPHLWVVGLALPASGTDYGVLGLLLRLPEKGGGRRGETMLPLDAALILWRLLGGNWSSPSSGGVRVPRLQAAASSLHHLPPDEMTFQAPCRED